jgi:hypothetical protein
LSLEAIHSEFISQREQRDQTPRRDTHSTVIEISFGNEVRIDQMRIEEIMRAPTSAYVRKHVNRM